MTATIPTTKTVAAKLNELERDYFFQRTNKVASGNSYISSNTWRAFSAVPKTDNVPSEALRAAFDFLSGRFEAFLQTSSNITRPSFDAFHETEVEALYHYLRTYRAGVIVQPRAKGSFHGSAYNAYCKVLNLAHTHWCFRRRPGGQVVQYLPTEYPQLRYCLHVPLDTKVLTGVGSMIDSGALPFFGIPRGGMGSVRTRNEYVAIQTYLRSEADKVQSTNFPGTTVSPLAFEGFW
jgi:hypothetical protein